MAAPRRDQDENERDAQVRSVAAAVEASSAVSVELSVTKSAGWAIGGFRHAADRYRAAAVTDADEVAWALYELVSWLDAVGYRYPELKGDATVRAMRFARGRAHHHLASVIELPERASGWQWRNAAAFPPPDPGTDDSAGERCYRTTIEGKSVDVTLRGAERAIERMVAVSAQP